VLAYEKWPPIIRGPRRLIFSYFWKVGIWEKNGPARNLTTFWSSAVQNGLPITLMMTHEKIIQLKRSIEILRQPREKAASEKDSRPEAIDYQDQRRLVGRAKEVSRSEGTRERLAEITVLFKSA
jgi:hypothetical protein